ncbi:hypothetical protein C4573_03965 [Candidatus Woesearchaeota archaeon]|nr:MAG: hypothetical protein C4573_03965 [Candidatus Woesearchaeota archaeon]
MDITNHNSHAKHKTFVLGVDVSATHTTIGFFGVQQKPVLIFKFRYPTKEIKKIEDFLNEVLQYTQTHYGITTDTVCLGIAGPLENNRTSAKLSNGKLTISVSSIKKNTPLKHVSLMNDFEIIGYSIEVLDKKDLLTLAKQKQKGSMAIIGPGSGLGKAWLVLNKQTGHFEVLPSEGGHELFGAQNDEEKQLLEFIKEKHKIKQVDYEKVLSGPGIANIFQFLRTKTPSNIADDPIMISQSKDPVCRRTMELFTIFLARACQSAALNILAYGGVYIGGGIAAKNLNLFKSSVFMKTFLDNPVHQKLLKEIPVYVITNYDCSLYGAANVAIHFSEFRR